MRRSHLSLLLVAALCLPSLALAQKKQKDPVLQAYLEERFAEVSKRLGEISEKVAALEVEIGKLKQQQADTTAEMRNAQTVARAMDSSLAAFRLSNQQDLLSLKTDITKIRQDVTTLTEGMKKAEAAAATPEAPKIEGYITAVSEAGKEVTINIGSAAGVKVGARFAVFRANDPKSQIGLIEVIEVLDANNSRARILHSKPDAAMAFSDIVRLE